MTLQRHTADPFRSAIAGVTPVAFVSDRHFPRHSHDQFGIGVIRSGGHKSWSGIGTVRALPGDLIMVNPGEIHDGAPLDGAARAWQILYFDPDVIQRDVGADFAGALDLVRPVATDPHLAARITALFHALTTTPSDPLASEQHLVAALISALRSHTAAKPAWSRHRPSVRRALDRIHSAPETAVSLAELAATSGVSRFQFLRAFSREVGVTPHAYILQHRVLRAGRLLAFGCTPADAALQAGFADQSHLARAFVRHLGVTPARYRAATAAISFKTTRPNASDPRVHDPSL